MVPSDADREIACGSSTVTVGWLGVMWALSLRHNWPKLPLLGSTALAIALAWLPEILLALGSGGLDLPFSGIAASTEGAQRVLLDLEGMGCEAGVRSAVEKRKSRKGL